MSSAHPLRSLVDRAAPITGPELYHLPDLGPCELVKGRIKPMSPTPWHYSELVTECASRLRDFVRTHNRGRVLAGDLGIYTSRSPDTVRSIDVAVLSENRYAEIQSESFLDIAPERIIEVFSPSNTSVTINAKIEEYFDIGVEQIWILDPSEEILHRHRSPDQVDHLSRDQVLHGEELLEGFQLSLSELFDS